MALSGSEPCKVYTICIVYREKYIGRTLRLPSTMHSANIVQSTALVLTAKARKLSYRAASKRAVQMSSTVRNIPCTKQNTLLSCFQPCKIHVAPCTIHRTKIPCKYLEPCKIHNAARFNYAKFTVLFILTG